MTQQKQQRRAGHGSAVSVRTQTRSHMPMQALPLPCGLCGNGMRKSSQACCCLQGSAECAKSQHSVWKHAMCCAQHLPVASPNLTQCQHGCVPNRERETSPTVQLTSQHTTDVCMQWGPAVAPMPTCACMCAAPVGCVARVHPVACWP
jgi:hypothetical protein